MGPAIIVVVLLVIPVMVILTGAVVAALLGYVIKTDVDKKFEGTEYLELS